MTDARIDKASEKRETDIPRRSRIAIFFSTAWRQLQDDWAIYKQNRLAMIGLGLIVIFAIMAISHPILMATIWDRGTYHPETGYDISMSPFPAPPRFPDHLLGVDALGRDTLSMLLAATRPSFTVALAAAGMTALISTVFGALSAYYRGVLDAVLSNIADALLLLPIPIVMVIIGSRFYNEIGSLEFGLLYGALAGASTAAIVMRSHALTLMNRPFIEAARVSGAGATHIIFRHLVPHMLPLVAVHMMVTVTGAIVAEGFIAFIGLRTDLRVNWGTMVFNSIEWATNFNPRVAWPAVLAPTMALSLFAAAFYFVARGLQDVSDPRMRDSRH